MKNLLILAFTFNALPAFAAEEPFCFPAQATYLMVDGSGQNNILEITSPEGKDCQEITVAYFQRGSEDSKLAANLVAGKGWKDLVTTLPGGYPTKYELTWAERSISLKLKTEQPEGICHTKASFGYDSYKPETASFELKFETDCGGRKVRSKATLYNF